MAPAGVEYSIWLGAEREYVACKAGIHVNCLSLELLQQEGIE